MIVVRRARADKPRGADRIHAGGRYRAPFSAARTTSTNCAGENGFSSIATAPKPRAWVRSSSSRLDPA